MNTVATHDGSASLRQGCRVVLVAALSVVFSFPLLDETGKAILENSLGGELSSDDFRSST
jgi:hypothetical protein